MLPACDDSQPLPDIDALEEQDSTSIASAFFGFDNGLPIGANFLCPGAFGMDGMPVNFKYSIDEIALQRPVPG